MTSSGISRWLRNHAETIHAAEGIRLVCRAVDETGTMANITTLDLAPPYDFRELSKDLVERCSDGAPDAQKVRIHLHLVTADGRQEFTSKVFKCVSAEQEMLVGPDQRAVARLLGQYVSMSQLLIEAAQAQYETSIRSQETQIALVHEVSRLIVEGAHMESALVHTGEQRTIGDRVADVAELAVAHQLGIPLEQIVKLRGAGTPPNEEPPAQAPENGADPVPSDLQTVRQYVASLTPEELRQVITQDPVIAVCVARAWGGKVP